MRRRRRRRSTPSRSVDAWIPVTQLGKKVKKGEITSLEEIFIGGFKISEAAIVDTLLPNLKEEVIHVTLVQKQTDAGEKSQFKALVAVGDNDGYLGLGSGKASQVQGAIEKASVNARLNVVPIRRGCGSWECGCTRNHSIPFKVEGKCGGVKIVILPGARGLGLVASEIAKTLLELAGIQDCWTKSFGSTRTVQSFAFAVFDALKNSFHLITPVDWVK